MKVPASYSVQRLPLENENAIREIILSSGDNPTENDYLLMMNELATCVLGQSFIKCPVRNCQVTPKGVTDFKDHLNAIHLKYPSHPCVHCDRINFTKKAQKRHLKGKEREFSFKLFFSHYFFFVWQIRIQTSVSRSTLSPLGLISLLGEQKTS